MIAAHCGFPPFVCAGEGASLDGGNGLRSLANALSKLLRVSSGNMRIIKFGRANHSHKDPCFLLISPLGKVTSIQGVARDFANKRRPGSLRQQHLSPETILDTSKHIQLTSTHLPQNSMISARHRIGLFYWNIRRHKTNCGKLHEPQ